MGDYLKIWKLERNVRPGKTPHCRVLATRTKCEINQTKRHLGTRPNRGGNSDTEQLFKLNVALFNERCSRANESATELLIDYLCRHYSPVAATRHSVLYKFCSAFNMVAKCDQSKDVIIILFHRKWCVTFERAPDRCPLIKYCRLTNGRSNGKKIGESMSVDSLTLFLIGNHKM